MSAPFANAEELNAFVTELRTDLDAAGLSDAARQLADIQGTAHTTGSEWQGSLKRAVRAIFRKEQHIPEPLVARLVRVLEPSFAERMAGRRYWRSMFSITIVLMVIAAVASLALIAAGSSQYVSVSIGAMLAALALLWIARRKISVCPGCGLRSQRWGRPFCAFCGMNRDAGSPGPKARPGPAIPPSRIEQCPACQNPPGGRSRYGRPLRAEGQFCECCGVLLPE